MRILIINYEYPPLGGGAGKASAALAREMTDQGHTVHVLTTRYGNLPHQELIDEYTVVRINALRRHIDRSNPVEMLLFLLLVIPASMRLSYQKRPDYTIAFFTIPSGPAAHILQLVYGIPYVISLRGLDVPGYRVGKAAHLYYLLLRGVTRFLWQHAAGVVANSPGLRELALKTAPQQKVDVIPNGIDLRKQTLKKTHHESLQILFVGRLVRQKGIDYLLNALALLDDVPYHLTLVGDGSARPALEQQAEQLGLVDSVTFTGWLPRNEVHEYYDQADIFTMPSHREGMSNAVLEAMAVGLPIVATAVSGNKELVKSGENGMLVPPADAAALAEALKILLNESVLRSHMGQNSYKFVQKYTWSRTALEYNNLLDISDRANKS